MADYEPFVAPDVSELIAVYPGTFDPITMGHIDIINRGLTLFDKVIVAIAHNSSKEPLFSTEERAEMIKKCFPVDEKRVLTDTVSGLMVDYAYTKGAKAIIRGLRAVSDFDYEFQLALMNRRIEREVETVFLMTGFRWIYISSSIIKDAARHGGDVSGLVPDHVCERLREKFLVTNGK
ncbi:MAG: pantetheine-phosphate adenylyltransferase [Proteobacteria bacterium]|nr:pantetheine-phosphate adenylyltransferase [Pseudomonadota bacterium]MBU1715190.1 pantetheine-phosphate adenylyltransferase [Pseudomonadota bacterium]